ncbi:hypothetical protein IK110_00945 [Candidatus Saccharibacteria bacterium]|nr:hypothetical protein [Candidatus Saccharibacteria bacterium]
MRTRKIVFGILLTIACMVLTASGAYAVSINIGPDVEGDIYSYLSLFGVSLAGIVGEVIFIIYRQKLPRRSW